MERKHAKEKRKREKKSDKEPKWEDKSELELKLEIMYVAQDVCHYLSSKVFPEDPIKGSGKQSQFHVNIGKACSYKLQFSRVSLTEVYSKDFPDSSLGSRDFLDWFQKAIVCSFFKIPTSPFNVFIESLTYMFDVIAHAKQRGQSNLYTPLPFIWTDFFMRAMYPDFFKEGGWRGLLKRARDIVVRYEKFFLKSEPGAMELISNLRKNDPARAVQGATGGINPVKQIPVPQHLQRAGLPPKMDESSELATTIQSLMDLKVEGAIKRMGTASETPTALETTSQQDLPGCRKKDPVKESDPELEQSLDSCPTDSESEEEESSIRESTGRGTDSERVPVLGLYSETPNREEDSCPLESTSSREYGGARQKLRKNTSRKRK